MHGEVNSLILDCWRGALGAAYMKSSTGRFRPPREPAVAYAVLMALPRSEATLDPARINDLQQQIDALQRQLKALQRGDMRSGSAETQLHISP
jgi:hypothetical protein